MKITMKNFFLLQLCIGEKWPEVRKYLSSDAEEEKKSNIMYRNHCGTCLHRACNHGAPDDIIHTMLDIGGKELVMMTKHDDWTVLHSVCILGASYNIIKMLIEVGGKDLVMAKSMKDNIALHHLCWFIKRHTKAVEKIKLILQVGGANLLLSITDCDGKTPLEIATGKGASNIIKEILTEHEEGEGTVIQSQTQSLKRRRVGNTINASSRSLNSNQAEDENDDDDDDAAIIAGQLDQYNMLMSRHLATRRELRSAKAQIAELKQEIDDLAILER
jgi:ankyrin repeat protein